MATKRRGDLLLLSGDDTVAASLTPRSRGLFAAGASRRPGGGAGPAAAVAVAMAAVMAVTADSSGCGSSSWPPVTFQGSRTLGQESTSEKSAPRDAGRKDVNACAAFLAGIGATFIPGVFRRRRGEDEAGRASASYAAAAAAAARVGPGSIVGATTAGLLCWPVITIGVGCSTMGVCVSAACSAGGEGREHRGQSATLVDGSESEASRKQPQDDAGMKLPCM